MPRMRDDLSSMQIALNTDDLQRRPRSIKDLTDMSLEELWQLFPIVLKEHNSAYPMWYEQEKAAISCALRGHDICRINHIGSTAVKGLIAKPIIDILLELPSAYEMDRVAAQLQIDGWTQMAINGLDQTIDLNKGYTPAGFVQKVYHLHIKPQGDWDELYFRDYLQAHPAIARQYEALKLQLRKLFEHDRDAYTSAKADFIMTCVQKARAEFGGRHMPAFRP